MGLKFAPLGWAYHDGWNWRQSKTLISYDQNGNKKLIDASKQCHQRGHVHLFLPTVEYSPSGSSLAYWGEQTYQFSVVDEWGPNSSDPSQNQSVRLVGKPLWYLYVEEYWRRMYIQPWDVVDETCTLPLNQEKTYTKWNLDEYHHYLISHATYTDEYSYLPGNESEPVPVDLHYSSRYNSSSSSFSRIDYTDTQLDGMTPEGNPYPIPTTYPFDSNEISVVDQQNFVGFIDYLTQQRRMVARRLYVAQKEVHSLFMTWLASQFGQSTDGMPLATYDESTDLIDVADSVGLDILYSSSRVPALYLALTWNNSSNPKTARLKETVDDKAIIQFLYAKTPVENGSTISYIDSFNEFFRYNAGRNQGYVEEGRALTAFMKMHSLKVKDGSKQSDADHILVPDDRTIGHIGIKFDASKPCHSLGPFMEGGEFYFFNTVVNRSMPCEYWLDEEMKSRQYFIKKEWNGFAQAGVDTNGDQTWVFSGDNSKFIWVQDLFEEARALLEDDYEDDSSNPTHRLPNIHNAWRYSCQGMNAKRLKDTYPVSSKPSDIGSDAHPLDNSKVPHETFFATSTDIPFTDDEQDDTVVVTPTYGDDDIDVEEQGGSSPAPTEAIKTLAWEGGFWTGWYEKDEIIRCSVDEEWYQRTWCPMRYSIESRFEGANPYWSASKRKAFPNPSPWLCDSADGTPRYSTKPRDADNPTVLPESMSGAPAHWCTSTTAYDNDEDTRLHLLHWEYALYFGLHRVYPTTSPSHPNQLRRHFFLYSTGGINPTQNTSFILVSADENGEYTAPHELNESGGMHEGIPASATRASFIDEIAADIETLMEEYKDENGEYPTSIETENSLFQSWIASLGSYFMKYQDRDIRWYRNGYQPAEIVDYKEKYHEDGSMYYTISVQTQNSAWEEDVDTLPNPEYTVSYVNNSGIVNDAGGHYRLQTYVAFEEFRKIWTPLTEADKRKLRLHGDMPQRKKHAPYGGDLATEDGIDSLSLYPELDENHPRHSSLAQGEQSFKENIAKTISKGIEGEQSPSLLISEFFPKTDTQIRAYNESKPPSAPAYTPSPLDEIGDSVIIDGTRRNWSELTTDQKKKYLQYYVETGAPIDPYRNGTVNPIDVWRKYFDHREVFTIPDRTTVGGDVGITNNEGSPNSPNVHPRETSFHHEDGARRHYPDDMYLSPVIEYQKIIRKDYERPDGKQQEEEWLNSIDEDGKPNWRTDTAGNWGDGFEITVTIPWKTLDEIQSPFSEDDHVTKPIGEYCHNCVKPENQLRHHIEFYDSLDQIRKYDFPNYVRIIHAFQKTCLPSGIEKQQPRQESVEYPDGRVEVVELDGTDLSQSFYHEDFNDYEKTEKLRKDGKDSGLADYNAQRQAEGLDGYGTWQEALNAYWTAINGNDSEPKQNIYINMPVMRSKDCHGVDVKENSFEMLDDGSYIWREQTTQLMPDSTKVEYLSDHVTPGYLDSNGNHIKGGGLVRFNNPYPEHQDGKWYEECLGAVCRARCVLVLEDRLGYRWKQVVEATALQPDQPIRGSDYDE